jgi:hypothetical protein
MSENTTLIIAIIGGIVILLFLVRYAVIGNKDKYNIDKLSKGELPGNTTGESFVERMGRMMGIKDLKLICDEAEKMIRCYEINQIHWIFSCYYIFYPYSE